MTQHKNRICFLRIFIVAACLIIGFSTASAYAYEVHNSRLKLDAELTGSTAEVNISDEMLESFSQHAKNAGYQSVRFSANVTYEAFDTIVFHVPESFFTYFFQNDFQPDMIFGWENRGSGMNASRWQELKASMGAGELEIKVSKNGMSIERTYAESLYQKVPSEMYETVSLLEPKEELFCSLGQQASAEGKNCIILDVTTENGLAENTFFIMKTAWIDYLKDSEQYMTLIFRWDGGETVLKPSIMEHWGTEGREKTETLTLMLSPDSCAILGGKAYPDEIQKVKDAEQQSAKQKLIDGVENTTIKLTTSRTKGSIKLNWKKSAGYKVDYYQVFRSVKKNSGYGTKAFYTTGSGTKTSYKNTKSLKAGRCYYYKVRGVRIIDGEKYYTQWSNKSWRTAI